MLTIIRLSVAGLLSALFFLMLSVYPLQYLPIFEYAYDWRRILQLCILGVFVLWLLLDVPLRKRWLQCYQAIPRIARIGILIFFVWGVISSLLAPMPRFALMQVGFYGLLWITVITIAALRVIYQENFDRWMLALLLIMSGCYGIYLLLVDVQMWFFGASQGMTERIRELVILAPGFLNIRFFANFISFSLPLMVLPSILYRHHSRVLRWIYFAVSAVWWYALILNHCQTLWLEWVVILVVVLIWFRSAGFVWLKQQLKALIGGLILYEVLTRIIPAFLHFTAANAPAVTASLSGSSDGRFALWEYTLKVIAHHPIFGVGPLHFAYYANDLGVAHPHNSVLLIAAEWGIPAMLLLMALVLWGVIAWVRRYRVSPPVDINRVKYIALFAAFLGGAIDSLLSGVIVMPLSQIMLVLVAGWMFGVYQNIKEKQSIAKRAHLGLIIIMVVAVALVWHGIYPLILHLPQQISIFIQRSCGGVYSSSCIASPNFWTQGWIQYYGIQ